MADLTAKQQEFLARCNHTYNLKCGAVRSGKTWLDIHITIPQRLFALEGKHGDILFLGHTQGSIERNVINPLRDYLGNDVVSLIGSKGQFSILGMKAYALGGDKSSSVEAIQGLTCKYVYIDEVVTLHPKVFAMVQSRLCLPYSVCDMTCNPSDPSSFVYDFIQKAKTTPELDLYVHTTTLDDNDHLAPDVIARIKAAYAGTVYYPRFVEGTWAYSEGIIYRNFADSLSSGNNRFLLSDIKGKSGKIYIGLDFGGSGSWHALVATMITPAGEVIALASDRRNPEGTDADDLAKWFYSFVEMVFITWGAPERIYMDSAEQVLIRHCKTYASRQKLSWISSRIGNAKKTEIVSRIRLTSVLMGGGRFFYLSTAQSLADALKSCMWDSKTKTGRTDTRLDDGTTDIDSLDAFEYSIEHKSSFLLRSAGIN